jgi:hypothetical protein
VAKFPKNASFRVNKAGRNEGLQYARIRVTIILFYWLLFLKLCLVSSETSNMQHAYHGTSRHIILSFRTGS